MITAPQLRAARGLLDWTRQDLAKAAGISTETVKNIEHGTFRPQETTAEAIVRAFAAHDVEFTVDEGVRIKRETVVRYEGVDGFKRFLDDVYEVMLGVTASADNRPVCAASINDHYFVKYLGDYFPFHVRRMNAVKNLKMRILHKEKPTLRVPEEKEKSYREYRLRPQQDTANVPFYVYGDKLAILIFEGVESAPHIVVISSPVVARAYEEQFEAMWNAAKPLVV